LLAQRPRPGVGLLHFGSRKSLDGHEGWTEGDLQVELTLRPCLGLGEHGQEFQPFRQVLDGFHVSRALAGLLPGTLPVDHGLLV
jgi:hypothetical protein